MMRNTLPPLASNDLFDGVHAPRSRRALRRAAATFAARSDAPTGLNCSRSFLAEMQRTRNLDTSCAVATENASASSEVLWTKTQRSTSLFPVSAKAVAPLRTSIRVPSMRMRSHGEMPPRGKRAPNSLATIHSINFPRTSAAPFRRAMPIMTRARSFSFLSNELSRGRERVGNPPQSEAIERFFLWFTKFFIFGIICDEVSRRTVELTRRREFIQASPDQS